MEEKDIPMEQQSNNIVEKIEQKIGRFEESQVLNVDNRSLHDEGYRKFIVDISRIVADEYVGLVEKLKGSHLEKFQDGMSKLSYKSTGNLLKDIEAWAVKRKEMIKIVDASADSLENSYFMATISRLLGSVVDLLYNLDSLTDNMFSGFVKKEAFAVHPMLGLVSQTFCDYGPHLAYLGLISSFVDVLNSKLALEGVVKIINEDIILFQNIEEWFQETNKFDEELKKLFPFGIDTDVVAKIEETLTDCDTYTKAFATVFFSNVQQNPSLMKDVTFLCKAYLFSRNNIAKEWYDRALSVKHPIEFEAEKMAHRAELMKLSKSVPDSDTTVQLGSHVVKLKNAPHFVQATINCVSIYFSFQELRIGTKHKNAEFLRELSRRSKFCLEELESIKRQLESK